MSITRERIKGNLLYPTRRYAGLQRSGVLERRVRVITLMRTTNRMVSSPKSNFGWRVRRPYRDGDLRRIRSGEEKSFVICCHDL